MSFSMNLSDWRFKKKCDNSNKLKQNKKNTTVVLGDTMYVPNTASSCIPDSDEMTPVESAPTPIQTDEPVPTATSELSVKLTTESDTMDTYEVQITNNTDNYSIGYSLIGDEDASIPYDLSKPSNPNGSFTVIKNQFQVIGVVDNNGRISDNFVKFGTIEGKNGVIAGLITLDNVSVSAVVNGTTVESSVQNGFGKDFPNWFADLRLNAGVNFDLTSITFGGPTPEPTPDTNPLPPIPTGENLPTVSTQNIPIWVPTTEKKALYYHQQWSIYGSYNNFDRTTPLNQANNTGRNYRIINIPDEVKDMAYAFWWVDEFGNIGSADDWGDHELPTYKNLIQPQKYNNAYTNETTGFQYPPQRFAGNDSKGNFGDLIDLNKSRKTREVNPLNCSITIGGWSFSRFFSKAVSTETTRTNFVNNCIYVLRLWQDIFNGIIFDWEYMTDNGNTFNSDYDNSKSPNDADNFTLFLQQLIKAIEDDGILSPEKTRNITIGIAITPAPEKAQFDINKLEPYVDEFHIMTYDFHGLFDSTKSGFHTNPYSIREKKKSDYPSPSYSVEDSIKYFIGERGQVSDDKDNLGFINGDKGGYPIAPGPITKLVPLPNIPINKLFIGTAFYSRGIKSKGPYTDGSNFTDTIDKELFPVWEFANSDTPVDAPGILPYSQIVEYANDSKNSWGNIMVDKDTKGAYILNTTKEYYLNFDNEDSIKAKIDLINNYKIGGMVIWETQGDIRITINNESSTKAPVNSLMKYISDNLNKTDNIVKKINSNPSHSVSRFKSK